MSQRDHALHVANGNRQERKAIRYLLHDADTYTDSRRLLARILEQPAAPQALHTLRAHTLLTWVPHMTATTAGRLLTAIGASEYITTGRLTERQRLELARLLRGDARTLKDAEDNQETQLWAKRRDQT